MTPSPTDARMRAACARSAASRYSSALSTATPARRPRSSADSRSLSVYGIDVSARTSVSAPSVRPRARSGTMTHEWMPTSRTCRRGLLGIAVREGDEPRQPLVVQEVHGAPVGDASDDEVAEAGERGFGVERRREQGARVREEGEPLAPLARRTVEP